MQLNIFKDELEKYESLDRYELEEGTTEVELIDKLKEIAISKKKIQNTINDFLDSFLLPLEENCINITYEDTLLINKFLNTFSNGNKSKDYMVYKRCHKLLLAYAKKTHDINKIIEELYYVGYAEFYYENIKKYNRHYDSFKEAITYKDKYSVLSKDGKMFLLKCYGNYAIEKRADFDKLREAINFIEEKKCLEPDLLPYDTYILVLKRNAFSVVSFCRVLRIHEKYPKRNYYVLQEVEKKEVTKEERILLEQYSYDVYKAYNKESSIYTGDRATVETHYYLAKFANNTITRDELLHALDEISKKEYNSLAAKFNAMCNTNAYYLEEIKSFSECSEKEKLKITDEKSKDVIDFLNSIPKNQITDVMQNTLLNFIIGVSTGLSFNDIKGKIYKYFIACHNSTYIHSVMVKEISVVILKKVIAKMPNYLEGILDSFKSDDIRNHSDIIIKAMEDMAYFHDLGKYFVINLIKLSYRKITNEEFNLIQLHPILGDSIVPGILPQSIREGIVHHHRWYNRKSGYPKNDDIDETNKPLVDILSIADAIDAATDFIGRPYSCAKSYYEIVDEFKQYYNTRYSGAIIDLLDDKKLSEEIINIINIERKRVTFDTWKNKL